MMTSSNAQNIQTTRWVLAAFLVVLLFIAVWLVRDILMLTLTAIILAVLMTTPVRFFVRRGAKRPFAVVLTLGLLVVILAIVIALLLPGLLDQFGKLLVAISDAITKLQDQLNHPEVLKANYPFLKDVDLTTIAANIQAQLPSGLADITSRVSVFFNGLASTLLSILIVIFLAMYFVADPGIHERGIVRMVPINMRQRAREILVALDNTLRRFLQGQIILMLFTGLSTGIELWLFGIPLAAVLGTIAGLFSFVPTFGPLVSLIPILAVSLSSQSVNPETTLFVVIVFFILQFIQSQIVTPILMGQEVNLPPAIILLSQIIAGIFFGFLGLLLSVPLAAILVVLVREIYIKDILGDTIHDEQALEREINSG